MEFIPCLFDTWFMSNVVPAIWFGPRQERFTSFHACSFKMLVVVTVDSFCFREDFKTVFDCNSVLVLKSMISIQELEVGPGIFGWGLLCGSEFELDLCNQGSVVRL